MPTEDFYSGRVAETYDLERSNSPIWRREDEIVEFYLRGLQTVSESLLLDVPVGTGRFFQLYEKFGITSIGFDISEDMLEKAHARSGENSHSARGDIRRLPIRGMSLGTVVCIRFMHLVSRSIVKKTLAELSRVVRPRGFLIVGARLHGAEPEPHWPNRFRNYINRTRRILRHRFGQANSRSHQRRWFSAVLRGNGLVIRNEQLVTRYMDGSQYSIFLLQMTDAGSRSHKKPASIELFGLPGVGKSTLFKALAEDPLFTIVDGFARMEELSFWTCVGRRPLATIGLLMKVAPSWRELRQAPAKKAVVTALRQLVAQKPSGDKILLFQEGTSHEVWRQIMQQNDISDSLISRLLPVADHTVLVEAPLERISERLVRKPHPGPINKELIGAALTGSLWKNATSSYARVRASITSSGERFVVLMNEGDIESGLRKLTQILCES